MYAFHVTVPKGVDHVDATLDFLVQPPAPDFAARTASSTATMALFEWHKVLPR
jgi:hypothetical protein